MANLRRPSTGILLGMLVSALLAACASAPPAVEFPPGSRVVVTYEEPQRNLRLALANESHPDLGDLYSHERPDASLKLAPDRLVGELLASLDRAGLAGFGTHVTALPPASRARVVVARDGDLHFMERPSGGDVEAARTFARLEFVMNEYYQHVGALQAVSNDRGGRLLRTQSQPGTGP